MLHAIILKFPRNLIDAQSQTLFMHFVISLANDDDRKVRSMSAAAIKCLIGHVSSHSLHSVLEYSLSWYLGGKQSLWGAAAQVYSLYNNYVFNYRFSSLFVYDSIWEPFGTAFDSIFSFGDPCIVIFNAVFLISALLS